MLNIHDLYDTLRTASKTRNRIVTRRSDRVRIDHTSVMEEVFVQNHHFVVVVVVVVVVELKSTVM